MKNKKEVIEKRKPEAHDGLTSKEVEQRVKAGLTNKIESKTSKSYARIIFENTFSFFSCVLFGIAIFIFICNLGVFPNIPKGTFGITKYGFLVPLLINIIIGNIQEIRSKVVLEKLKIINESKYFVVRDGECDQLSTNNIVSDDILQIMAGQQAPSDMEIIDGEIEVNESLLTGESDNIKKKPGDKVYSGSLIISGKATCYCEKVGYETYAMKLQNKVKEINKNKSELMKNIYSIIKVMSFVLFLLSMLDIGVLIWKMQSNTNITWPDIVQSVTAIAIGCIPSGLVLLTSVTLAVSVIFLVRKKVLVQELYSLENLSRVDVICFDKTGTLTDGTMKVEEDFKINDSIDSIGYLTTLLAALPDHNTTSNALIEKYGKEEKYKVTKVIPFSSERKMSSVFIGETKIVLGAPEYVLEKEDLIKFNDFITKNAEKGLRVLALTKDNKAIDLITISDGIRSSAVDTIKYFKDNGVQVKIISGDNPVTVSKIAKLCGVENADKCINMQNVSIEEIPEIVENYTVFGRISPEQKEAIVKSLQQKNHKVAMTGDGVNDILALKAANASITFQSATDAAKGLADVVLMDDSFDHIADVVTQGRRVVNNVQRTSILFLMKTFFIIFITFLTIPTKWGTTFISVENLYVMQTSVTGIAGVLLSIENTKKPISGTFKSTVYPKAIASGLFLAVAAFVSIFMFSSGMLGSSDIDSASVAITKDVQRSLATILTTVAGTVVLYKICFPTNKYKRFVLIVSMLASTFMLLAYPDLFLNPQWGTTLMDLIRILLHPFNFSNSIYTEFNKYAYISIIVFGIVAIPIYLIIIAIIDYILKKRIIRNIYNKCKATVKKEK